MATSTSRMTDEEIAQVAIRARNRTIKMLPTLTSFARVLTNNPKVTVAVTATTPHTDGKTIFVQPLWETGMDYEHPDTRRCNERDQYGILVCAACKHHEHEMRLLFHEISHILFDSFNKVNDDDKFALVQQIIGEFGDKSPAAAAIQRWLDQQTETPNFVHFAKFISPWFPTLLNILEDVRVDRSMLRARPGVSVWQRAEIMGYLVHGITNPDGTHRHYGELEPDQQFVIGLYMKGAGADYRVAFAPEVCDALDDPELGQLAEKAFGSRGMRGVYLGAFPVLRRARQLGYLGAKHEEPEPEPEPEVEQPQQSTDQDRTEKSDEAGDNENTDDQPEGQDDPAGDSDVPENDEDSDQDASEGEPGEDSDQDAGEDDSQGEPGEDDSQGEPGEDGDQDDSQGEPGEDGDQDASEGEPGEDGDQDASEGQPGEDGDQDASEGQPGEDGDQGEQSGAGSSINPLGRGDIPQDLGDDDFDDEDEDDYDDLDDEDDYSDDDYDGDLGEPAPSKSQPEPQVEDEPEPDTEPDDDFTKAMNRITGHTDFEEPEGPAGGSRAAATFEDALDRAEKQHYFDEPSMAIVGVRVQDQYGMMTEMGVGFPSQRKLQRMRANTQETQTYGLDIPPTSENILGPVLAHSRITLADNKKKKRSGNLKSGSVNVRVLASRVPVNNPRVFEKIQKPGRRDYFVLLGMDISGSTQGHRIALIKESTMAMAETMNRLGIKFAVAAHSGSVPGKRTYSSGAWEVDIVWIKTAEQPWNEAARQRLRDVCPDGCNIDGHTMEYYRKYTERQHATDRIIMYFNDGQMPNLNYTEELEILHREIDLCRRQRITLMGVGINSNDPERYGFDSVRIDSMDDVVKVVTHLRDRLERA